MERSLRSSGKWHVVQEACTVGIVMLLVVQAAACGGGGGGGGGGGSGGDAGEIQVGETATFLSREQNARSDADPRTSHHVEVTLSGVANPLQRLSAKAIEVRRDGRLDVEAHVSFNDDEKLKRNLTLIIDVSGSLTADDLQDVKKSAQDFVAAILPVAGRLRIYTFASQSETDTVGEYQAISNGTTFTWDRSPSADIQAIQRGSDSTALFHAVRRAIKEQPTSPQPDIFVVFSDGRENSSPEGAREEALKQIREKRIKILSVGFGRVDADDLERLSENGRFVGVRPSLVGLFDDVAREVLSTYTVVYDTPTAFGSLTLDVRIEADKRRYQFETSLLAGIDLARVAVGRFPTLPGSSVQLRDLRTTPPTTTTYTVAPLVQALRRDDGLLAFAIDADAACTGPSCGRHYQGVYGAGAQSEAEKVYVPAQLTEELTHWVDPISGENLTFDGYEDQVFFSGDKRRRYRCVVAKTDGGGTYWFAPEVGLVRIADAKGNTLVELAEPPCLTPDFLGKCTTE